METKNRKYYTTKLSDVKFDTNGEGTVRAKFAALNETDKDGDYTINGAFGEQQVKFSQYNHGSWGQGAAALPIGVGRIYEDGEMAIFEGEFDLEDADAVKTYKKLKYFHTKGHDQEWSYALPDIDYEYGNRDGQQVRILKRISVPEVSAVLMGAGNNTRMLDIKSGNKPEAIEEETEVKQTFAEHADTTLESVRGLVKRYREIAELRKIAGTNVSKKSTDRMLELRDNIKSILTDLDELYKSVDSKSSDYLMLQELKVKYKE